MTLAGLLTVIFFIGLTLSIGSKLIPIYIENYEVKKSLERAITDPKFKQKTLAEIRAHFSKDLAMNAIQIITADKLVVIEKENSRVVQLDYEVRKPFLGNIDFILSFHYEENV